MSVCIPMASPTSLKRTSGDAGLDFTAGLCTPTDTGNNYQTTQTPSGDILSGGSPPLPSSNPSQPNVRGPGPDISTYTDTALRDNTAASTPAGPAPKRRKLTVAEKEVKRLEKGARKKQKAEERAKKDEEKAIKDEEKRLKDLEKEDKQKAKEVEKQAKEAEKKRKEAERRLKEEEKQKKDDEKHEKEKVGDFESAALVRMPLKE